MASEVQVIGKRRSLPSRVLLLKAGLMLIVIRCCLVFTRFHRLRRTLVRALGNLRRGETESDEEIACAVARASRSIPGATCLVAALACEIILLRHGHNCELHVGVMVCPDHELEAHAWVDCNGQTILGEEVNCASFRKLTATGE